MFLSGQCYGADLFCTRSRSLNWKALRLHLEKASYKNAKKSFFFSFSIIDKSRLNKITSTEVRSCFEAKYQYNKFKTKLLIKRFYDLKNQRIIKIFKRYLEKRKNSQIIIFIDEICLHITLSKVTNLDIPLITDKYIEWFQIPMNNIPMMAIIYSTYQLFEIMSCFCFRKSLAGGVAETKTGKTLAAAGTEKVSFCNENNKNMQH